MSFALICGAYLKVAEYSVSSYYDPDKISELGGLMIAGCGIGVASVVYGFVRPFFYHKNSNLKISMNIGAVQTSHGFEPGISYNLSW